jgi:hypothetical protein
MRRFAILLVAVAILIGITITAETPSSNAFSLQDVPPTNTKRPVSPTKVLTNTPRASLVIPSTNTPTRTFTPSRTLSPTRTPSPTRTLSPTPSITPTTLGPINYPENINPLTGLPYPDEASKNRRNIIVKVSNYTWVVRPQSGLSLADVVWEYEVEGNVTRFAAIYRSHGVDHVGSVRSARLPDLELVPMYQALLAYSGANDNIKEMILKGTCLDDKGGRMRCPEGQEPFSRWNFQAITPQFGDNCPPFCRFPRPGIPFEHTLFANVYQVWDLAAKRNVNNPLAARGFAFSLEPDEAKKLANDIFIKWPGDQDARWQYNANDGKYYRWNTGIPHVDANTGQQLTAENVVVIQTHHRVRPDIYESETGTDAIEVAIWGQEKAWVFRDGRWYEGLWMRRNRERGALQLLTADGKAPIRLKPGVTWVQVVRCCNMFGVTASTTMVDANGTSTPMSLTATAKGPRLPASSASQTAAAVEKTNAASAATAGIKLTTPAPVNGNDGSGGGNNTGTATLPSVGNALP